MSTKLIIGSLLNYLFNNFITHLPAHFIRRGFLRLFNRKIDRTTVILMHTRILNFWNIEIGARVVINQYCLLDCRKHPIKIGYDTDIGPYTRIWTLGHNPDSNEHELYGGEVIVGHHVWIASGVTILPKVSIGDGAVVGAASLVHKAVPGLEIVAGNPARTIRARQNDLYYRLSYRPILD